jgi:hypothetical protein
MIKITHTDYEVILSDTNRETSYKHIIFNSQNLIQKIIYYKQLERIIILFNRDYYKKDSQNVICIDTKGNLQWIIPPLESEVIGNKMVNIDIRKNKYLMVYSFDGVHRRIDMETGNEINRIFGK